jgi:hypothetical protein
MSTAHFVKLDATQHHETALIAKDGSVWIVMSPRLWDIATWLWWWLAPVDRKCWVTLRTNDGGRLRARAVRVAANHVRMGSIGR